jgi:hypothetical protein
MNFGANTIVSLVGLNKYMLYFLKESIANFNMYLYYTVVKMYFSSVACLNNGHDMGKEGLRTFKKHLGAHELWRKYLCTFTRTDEEKV